MNKENDLFLNMVANPTLSLLNLQQVGLTAKNTSIALNEDVYKEHPLIKNSPMFKAEDGSFDLKKFHNAFLTALNLYINLATDTNPDDIISKATFDKDSIFSPINLRNYDVKFEIVKLPNPFLQKTSTQFFGSISKPKFSVEEIAEKAKVLANPTKAYNKDGTINPDKAIWHDAPNDSFFTDFFDTRVLAQWDYDADKDGNATKDESKIVHHKGDLKTNEDGSYYYENLDGRDIYGRRVLNKMNTLTTDGSFANKFDFLDSDDVEKSTGGTIMKNLALVGSMYIPYAGPWIAGLSVATQCAGLLSTLGKMATLNSNNSTLSAIEGWTKSVDRKGLVSEKGQQDPWSWENMINLVGDVCGQVREQRVLFKYAPAIFKGKWGMNEETQAELEGTLLKGLKEKNAMTSEQLFLKGLETGKKKAELEAELNTLNNFKAEAELNSYMKDYNKIGEVLSKAYMTGITVGDTYGEAKEAGASDLEATALTLGYGAAEATLLNTGVGEWLFPELRAQGIHQKAIAEAMLGVKKETEAFNKKLVKESLKKGEKELKKDYVKRIFNIGKQKAEEIWSGAKSTGGRTLANALANAAGEGVEETSEEILKDVSVGCFNLVNWLRGDDTHMKTNWRDEKGNWTIGNAFSDYALNALGGAIGGSLSGLSIDAVKAVKDSLNITPENAWKQFVHIAVNPEERASFEKTINKATIGTKELSAIKVNENGDPMMYDENDPNDINQDLAAKLIIKLQLDMVKSIVDSKGIGMSDKSFLNGLTNIVKDLKVAGLLNTYAAGRLVNRFNEINSLIADLVKTGNISTNATANVDASDSQKSKANKEAKEAKTNAKESGETSEESKLLNLSERLNEAQREKLKELIKEKKEILEGKHTGRFVQEGLFELSLANMIAPANFMRWAEGTTHKKYHNISKEEIPTLKEKYNSWLKNEKPDIVSHLSSIYYEMASKGSKVFKLYGDIYESKAKHPIAGIETFMKNRYGLDVAMKMGYIGANYGNGDVRMQILQNQVFGNDDYELRLNNIHELGRMLIRQFGNPLEQEAFKTLEKNIDEATIEAVETKNQAPVNKAKAQLIKYAADFTLNHINDLTSPYIEKGFINTEVKHQVLSLLSDLQGHYRSLEETDPSATEKVKEIAKQTTKIQNLSHSPIEKFLLEWGLSTMGEDINISQLIAKVDNMIKDSSTQLKSFTYDDITGEEIDNALNLIKMFAAVLEGSRVDNGDFGNLFGYNKTINDVNEKLKTEGYTPMAELSGDTANVFLLDINILKNKLKFVQDLYYLNQGNKLETQSRVRMNKDYLFYRRMKRFIITLDDGLWKDVDKLKQAINNATTLDENGGIGQELNMNVTPDIKEQMRKEMMEIENAIYDFFNNEDNKKILQDPEQLAKLFTGIDLYSTKGSILNEGTVDYPRDDLEEQTRPNGDFDDNAFIWWMAARAAVKSKDFYWEYSLSLDDEFAPIAIQEMATYLNYASVINGDVIKSFANGYKQAVINDWQTKSSDDRLKIGEQLGLNLKGGGLDFTEDEIASKVLSIIPSMKYTNIVFTEGIPGSGKTTGVLGTTLKMLVKFHQDSDLLKNVFVAHGVSKERAEQLAKDLNLDPDHVKCFGVKELMEELSSNYTQYTQNEDGSYTIPDTDYTQNKLGETISKRELRSIDPKDAPTLILIDELSDFDKFDCDVINLTCELLGITTLAAGDLDQSGVNGNYDVSIKSDEGKLYKGGKPGELTESAAINRINFIRSWKLGVSMRTSNNQKTKNTIRMQEYISQKASGEYPGKLTFSYCFDENGLHGDRILNYDPDSEYEEQEAIQEELDKSINSLFDHLEEGEKVHFITSDVSSKLSDYLKDKYGDKIEIHKGNSAKGLEGRYYIMEVDNDSDNPKITQNFDKDLYTGFTRSEEASVILMRNMNDNEFEEDEDTKSINESYDKDVIRKASELEKKTLDKINPSGNKVEYVKKKSNKVTSPESKTESTDSTKTKKEKEEEKSIPSENKQEETPPPAGKNSSIDEEILKKGIDMLDSIEFSKPEDFAKRLGVDINIAKEIIKEWTNLTGKTLKNPRKKSTNVKPLSPREIIVKEEKKSVEAPTDPSENFSEEMEIALTSLENAGYVEGLKFYSKSDNNIIRIDKIEPYRDSDSVKEFIRISYTEFSGNNEEQIENIYSPDFIENVLESFNENIQTSNYVLLDDEIDPLLLERLNIPQITSQSDYDGDGECDGGIDVDDDIAKEKITKESKKRKSNHVDGELKRKSNKTASMLIGFYTHPTNEYGVQWDNDGLPVPYEFSEKRIDSINGLLKIMQLIGNKAKPNKEAFERIMDHLRDAITNSTSRGQLTEKIQAVLNKFLKIGNNPILIRFGFESNAIDTKNPESCLTQDEEYSKSARFGNEEVRGLIGYSDDSQSKTIERKKICCYVAMNINGEMKDILSIPYEVLSNPWKIMEMRSDDESPMYPDLMKIASGINRDTVDELDAIQQVLNELINQNLVGKIDSRNNEKTRIARSGLYKDLFNLFELYKFTQNGIFEIQKRVDGKLTSDPDWVPGQMSYMGLLKAFSDRNVGYENEQDRKYDLSFTDVSIIALQPGRLVSKVLTSRTGQLYDENGVEVLHDGNSIFKKGYPFVLLSSDSSINTRAQMISLLIKQEKDSSEPVKVVIGDVLSPKISVEEYIEGLHQFIDEKTKDYNQGYGDAYTSFKILETLFNDDEFKQNLLDDDYFLLPNGSKAQFILAVDNLIHKLSLETRNEDGSPILEGREALKKEMKGKLPKLDKETYEGLWYGLNPERGFLKNSSVSSICNSILKTLCYKSKASLGTREFTKLDSVIESINKALGENYGIRYNCKIKPNSDVNGISEIEQDDNWTITTSKGSYPFQILGKFESGYHFGECSDLIEGFLNQICLTQEGMFSTYKYRGFISDDYVSLKRNKSRSLKLKSQEEKRKNPIYEKLLLTYPELSFDAEGDINQWAQTLRDNGYLSFVSTDKMFILDNNTADIFKDSGIESISQNGNINEEANIDVSKEFTIITKDGTIYNTIYSIDLDGKQILTLIDQKEQKLFLKRQSDFIKEDQNSIFYKGAVLLQGMPSMKEVYQGMIKEIIESETPEQLSNLITESKLEKIGKLMKKFNQNPDNDSLIDEFIDLVKLYEEEDYCSIGSLKFIVKNL